MDISPENWTASCTELLFKSSAAFYYNYLFFLVAKWLSHQQIPFSLAIVTENVKVVEIKLNSLRHLKIFTFKDVYDDRSDLIFLAVVFFLLSLFGGTNAGLKDIVFLQLLLLKVLACF